MSFLWHGLTEQGAQVPVQVDAQGRVIAVDGTPGASNWDRTNGVLSPAVPTDSVDIGSGNINLNANGTGIFASLGIGTTTPTQKIHIYESQTNIGAFLQVEEIGGQNAYYGVNTSGAAIQASGNNLIQFYTDGTQRVRIDGSGNFLLGGTLSLPGSSIPLEPKISLNADGSATFAGNITAANVTFRSSDPKFYVKKSKSKDALPEYVGPELDLLAEIARLEALVRHLYETLRLAPPAGWPVWDGNDNVLRQLRK